MTVNPFFFVGAFIPGPRCVIVFLGGPGIAFCLMKTSPKLKGPPAASVAETTLFCWDVSARGKPNRTRLFPAGDSFRQMYCIMVHFPQRKTKGDGYVFIVQAPYLGFSFPFVGEWSQMPRGAGVLGKLPFRRQPKGPKPSFGLRATKFREPLSDW